MLERFLDNIGSRPLRMIQFVLSGAVVVFGAYMLTPWYEIERAIGVNAIFEQPLALWALGATFVVAGLSVIVGLSRNHPAAKSKGMFTIFLSLLFISFLRMLNFGLFPMIWLFPLANALIAAILFIQIKLDEELWTQR